MPMPPPPSYLATVSCSVDIALRSFEYTVSRFLIVYTGSSPGCGADILYMYAILAMMLMANRLSRIRHAVVLHSVVLFSVVLFIQRSVGKARYSITLYLGGAIAV